MVGSNLRNSYMMCDMGEYTLRQDSPLGRVRRSGGHTLSEGLRGSGRMRLSFWREPDRGASAECAPVSFVFLYMLMTCCRRLMQRSVGTKTQSGAQ